MWLAETSLVSPSIREPGAPAPPLTPPATRLKFMFGATAPELAEGCSYGL